MRRVDRTAYGGWRTMSAMHVHDSGAHSVEVQALRAADATSEASSRLLCAGLLRPHWIEALRKFLERGMVLAEDAHQLPVRF